MTALSIRLVPGWVPSVRRARLPSFGDVKMKVQVRLSSLVILGDAERTPWIVGVEIVDALAGSRPRAGNKSVRKYYPWHSQCPKSCWSNRVPGGYACKRLGAIGCNPLHTAAMTNAWLYAERFELDGAAHARRRTDLARGNP